MASRADLQLRRIRRSDWEWIERWFEDPDLDAELGPFDLEWLEHVLTASDGAEFVMEDAEGPAVLIGCSWGEGEEPHVVTDIATDPDRRRCGLAKRALAMVTASDEVPPGTGWAAHVHRDNSEAFAFFESVGWTHRGLDDGFDTFTSQPSA